jgi:predicted transcriptional regulator
MRFNCQFTVRYLLPAFRSIISKQLLTKHKLTQGQVASKLGVTQAAVSHYMNSKRATNCRRILGDDFLPVHSLACETAKRITNNKTSIEEMQKDFCKVCKELREKYVENYII